MTIIISVNIAPSGAILPEGWTENEDGVQFCGRCHKNPLAVLSTSRKHDLSPEERNAAEILTESLGLVAHYCARCRTQAYAPTEAPKIVAWTARKEKWEAIRCIDCNKRTYRLSGDNGRRHCRGCAKAIDTSQLAALAARKGR